METMRQEDKLSHQFCGQRGGGTSTDVAPWRNITAIYILYKPSTCSIACFCYTIYDTIMLSLKTFIS